MIYIMIGVLIVVWFVAAIILIYKVMDAAMNYSNNPVLIYTLAFIFFPLSIAGVIYLADIENRKGPCVKHETQMHYNPATKTIMPAKVCVQRGEWVDNRGDL